MPWSRGKKAGPDGGPPSEADAEAMALRYLGRREYAEAELTRKLQHRGVEDEIAKTVVAGLSAQNLVSDERFAEAWVRHRVLKGFGPGRIRAELRSRGVGDARVAQALAPFDEQWHELARNWVERRHRGPLDEKARARLYRGGMNRGFSHDQVMRAIDYLRSQESA